MLSQFQTDKLTYFFHLLDFNRNGVITVEDFEAIAENLCVLWGFHEGTQSFDMIMQKCRYSWETFIKFYHDSDVKEASLEDWLEFADKNIVNANEETYKIYVSNMVAEIFDFFDTNRDNYISIEEFIDLFMAYRIEIRYSAKSFTKLDLNGDERLSRSELLKAVAEYFRSDNEEDKGNWLFGFWLSRIK